MHPEHEQLKAQFAKPERKIDHHFLIISILALGLLALVGAIFFFFLPRTQTFQFAKTAHEIVFNSQENTDKINQSLETFYESLNPEEQDAVLSSTLDFKLIATDRSDTFQQKFLDFFEKSLALFNGSNVLGFTTPDSDPSKEDRKRRELAVEIEKNTKEAQKLNVQLSGLLKKQIPSGAQNLETNLEELNTETDFYINQAEKTSLYYVEVADASIEITKLANATGSFKDIDRAVSRLSSLKSNFVNKNEDELPEEIVNFNDTLVEILDLYIQLYKDLKGLETASAQTQENLVGSYRTTLNSLAIRFQSDEIDFWQNNSALSNYDELSSQQTSVLKEAENTGDDNSFFLLEWMGVKIKGS